MNGSRRIWSWINTPKCWLGRAIIHISRRIVSKFNDTVELKIKVDSLIVYITVKLMLIAAWLRMLIRKKITSCKKLTLTSHPYETTQGHDSLVSKVIALANHCQVFLAPTIQYLNSSRPNLKVHCL